MRQFARLSVLLLLSTLVLAAGAFVAKLIPEDEKGLFWGLWGLSMVMGYSVWMFLESYYNLRYISGINGNRGKTGGQGTIGLRGKCNYVNGEKNNVKYFFKGGRYFKYTSRKMGGVFYEGDLKKWRGVPSNIDAVFQRSSKDTIYFFKGDKYYRVANKGDTKVDNVKGSNLSIWFNNLDKDKIPDHIDAVYEKNNNIYFFSGEQYWKYSEKKKDILPGYQKSITKTFGVTKLTKNSPDKKLVDAAFVSSNGSTIYFFKEKFFWKYGTRPDKKRGLFDNYPKNISEYFPGLPDNIDGVFMRTYN